MYTQFKLYTEKNPYFYHLSAVFGLIANNAIIYSQHILYSKFMIDADIFINRLCMLYMYFYFS